MASALYHIGSSLFKEFRCDRASESLQFFIRISEEYKSHKYFNKHAEQKIKIIKKECFKQTMAYNGL